MGANAVVVGGLDRGNLKERIGATGENHRRYGREFKAAAVGDRARSKSVLRYNPRSGDATKATDRPMAGPAGQVESVGQIGTRGQIDARDLTGTLSGRSDDRRLTLVRSQDSVTKVGFGCRQSVSAMSRAW